MVSDPMCLYNEPVSGLKCGCAANGRSSVAAKRWRSWAATAALVGLAGCAKLPPAILAPAPPAVCYECLWVYNDPVYGKEILEVYEDFRSRDPVVMADVRYVLARMHHDPERVCDALRAFHRRRRARGELRRLYVAETLAFTVPECGLDPAPYFERAADLADRAGQHWKAGVYREVAGGRFEPTFGSAEIGTTLSVPDGTVGFILGESAIRVPPGTRVGVQMERTVRDWLSYQMEYDLSPVVESQEEILWYHEGARLKDLLQAVPLQVVPLPGTLMARKNDEWFAPDEQGVFRFGVLADKVQYPTTRAWGDLGLLMDTHGISSLVESAVREDADLVVGCGDHPHKLRAAYHLATLGKDVYFPCDRFVGELLGYDAEGVLIGSAPVRPAGDSAVIGDRPVLFRIDDILVVENSSARGRYQYYDAPARYFRRLSEALELRIEWVEVDGPGESDRVVQRAEQVGASVIAVRVETEEDHGPVAEWLAGSPHRRAVLFHTAPYPTGYRLFEEFPGQTTFGDPRPRFLTAPELERTASEKP